MIEHTTQPKTPIKPINGAWPRPTGVVTPPTGAAANPAAAPDTIGQTAGRRLRVPSLGLRVSERRLMLMVVDTLLVNLALIIAHTLAGNLTPMPDALTGNLKWFVSLTIVWLGTAVFFDCYDLARSASVTASVRAISLALITASLIYAFLPYFTPMLDSRGPAFVMFVLAYVMVVSWRVFYARVFVQPWFGRRALIVGAGTVGKALAAAMQAAPRTDANPFRGTGYEAVGFIDDDLALRGETISGVPVIGDHHNLLELAKVLHVNEIILAISNTHSISDEMMTALLNCREQNMRVVTMATVYERLTGRVPIEYVGRDLQTVLPMDENVGERVYQAFKRGIDILSALVGLSIMAVAIVPIWILNLLTSPGPLFYKQRRVGQGGRIFEMYKFRSMRPDAEKGTGAVWAQKNDDRITPAGKFIRKTRVDELPQFVNVLKGEMSLVGPRPERPEFVNALALMVPYYRARHAVKPGITGWAQIKFSYGNTHQDARIKLEHDLYYVKHASPLLDTMIMLQTLPVMASGKGL